MTLTVDGHRLETLDLPATIPGLAPIVLLHEGLGSVAHWKDFPFQLADRTGARVFLYSRYGHGNSDPLTEPRDGSYLEREALVVLPDVLRQAEIEKPVLVGHSDGASIAILFAGAFPDAPAGIVLEAPHTFVEDVALEGIRRTNEAFQSTELRSKLDRYHADVDGVFRGWRDIWLDPRFHGWNIESSLDTIRCPVLVIQGADDEYGTTKQVEMIQARVPSGEVHNLKNCRHTPHRERPDEVLDLMVRFVKRFSRL